MSPRNRPYDLRFVESGAGELVTSGPPALASDLSLGTELAFAGLDKIAALLDSGQISARELAISVLQRIEKWCDVGAYSDIVVDNALQQADAADNRRRQGQWLGPLDGVPVAVKDLIDTTPTRCSSGLSHLRDYRPAQDANIVRRLRVAGAVIVGVVHTDSGAFGTSTREVVNPLDPDRIVGGSSGGSGAALAAGLAYAAIGTDTGGSIRIPSACCSVCGFKPSWGRWPLEGIRPLAPSLDHVGPMARSVADLVALQDALAPDGLTGPFPRRQLIVGIPHRYFADADPLVVSAMAKIAHSLAKNGMEVRPVGFPSAEEAMSLHMVTALAEIAKYHRSQFGDVWQSYPELARQTIVAADSISSEAYERAQLARIQMRNEVEKALEGFDMLVVPTMPMDVPTRDARDITIGDRAYAVLEATIRYTALFNQTGHPVVALPGLLLADGRAVGIQAVGKLHDDAALLVGARHIERTLAVRVDYNALLARHETKLTAVRHQIDEGERP